MLLDFIATVFEAFLRDNIILLLILLALPCWRLWRFTVTPHLNPSVPKELPYWIPCHAFAFFKDFNEAIDNGRKYFDESDKPFTVTLGGVQMHICYAPEDVASLYRNTTTISYHPVVKSMYQNIGVSDDGFKKMFALDASAKHNIGMSHPLNPCEMVVEYHRRQLKPGDPANELVGKRINPAIDRRLQGVVEGTSFSILEASDNGTTVSLLRLCTDLLLHSTVTAFLGHRFWQVNPSFLDLFELWERENWKFMFQMPAIMSRDTAYARDGIVNTFVKYLAIPAQERSDSNDFVRSVETMLRDVGVAEQDMAKVFMLHFWAVLGNVYKVAFWTIAHIVYDESLYRSIRAELMPALRDGKIDETYVNECPLLESLISEVLRLTVATALVRDVHAPTVLRDTVLQPGSKVLIPYLQLHQSQTVWGDEPLALDPTRFYNNPKLASSKSYRPFGGGQTLCPGRFMAKNNIKYTIASILTQFDLTLDVERTQQALGGKGDSVNFPRIDCTKPSPGVSLPVKGQDVYIIVKEMKTPK